MTSEIADDVHDFMIAGEDDGLAAGAGLGLLLEPHQQIHHLAHVGAAVGVVAGLHPDRAPTAPLQRIVDEAGAAEDGGDPVVRTMNVADGDETGWGLRGEDRSVAAPITPAAARTARRTEIIESSLVDEGGRWRFLPASLSGKRRDATGGAVVGNLGCRSSPLPFAAFDAIASSVGNHGCRSRDAPSSGA